MKLVSEIMITKDKLKLIVGRVQKKNLRRKLILTLGECIRSFTSLRMTFLDHKISQRSSSARMMLTSSGVPLHL